ncbi:MAG: DNA-binding protein [Candidatus Omnitrophota bacterium]
MIIKTQSQARNIFTFFLLLGFLFCTAKIAVAQSLSSSELINNAKQYDGKTVVFEGEVIGDIMQRGEYAWVNLYGGESAIGIWINSSLTKDILYTGSYKAKGDLLEVTGIFHRACAEHGGDLDIHAAALRKIAPGRNISHKINPAKRNWALLGLGVVLLAWILTRLKSR